MRSTGILSCSLFLIASTAFGYTRSFVTLTDGTKIQVQRTDNTAMQFLVNGSITPGASVSGKTVITATSDPVSAIQGALTTWNAATAANIKFLPLKSTTLAVDPNDGKSVISLGTTSDFSALGGALAVTRAQYSITQTTTTTGGVSTLVTVANIADTDIIFNPTVTFSTNGGANTSDFQSVLTHELGHAMGADHSQILSAVMYPALTVGSQQRFLTTDEIAMAASIYPRSTPATGTLRGRIMLAGGPVKTGLVTFIDTSTGAQVGTYTGTDGNYSVAALPGSYIVYTEPFNTTFQLGNLAGIPSSDATTGFEVTFLGGSANPSAVTVTAGAITTVGDLNATATAATLNVPLIAVAKAGSSASSLAQGFVPVGSGQQIDLIFFGQGTTLDASTTVRVYGGGVTLVGSAKLDSSTIGGVPLVRQTMDVASSQTQRLATVVFTKGTSSVVLSGALLVVPPKPATTSASVISAASFVGGPGGTGLVTPGGIYSIYGIPSNGTIGPTTFVSNAPDYDAYGKLPAILGGVVVTFDGVPAPMFLSFSGQLNMQVPFEVAGKTTTQVVINFLGSVSDPIVVPVAAEQPAFFTATAGSADSIVINITDPKLDALNAASTPAARGSVVTFYGTGVGKLSYDVPTGVGAPGPPASYTGGGYKCTFGTVTFDVAFTGWTPTAVGLAQFSMVIPQTSPTGKVSVVCTSPGGAKTQTGTIYVN